MHCSKYWAFSSFVFLRVSCFFRRPSFVLVLFTHLTPFTLLLTKWTSVASPVSWTVGDFPRLLTTMLVFSTRSSGSYSLSNFFSLVLFRSLFLASRSSPSPFAVFWSLGFGADRVATSIHCIPAHCYLLWRLTANFLELQCPVGWQKSGGFRLPNLSVWVRHVGPFAFSELLAAYMLRRLP